jgi:hypothetical protein
MIEIIVFLIATCGIPLILFGLDEMAKRREAQRRELWRRWLEDSLDD